MKNEPMRRRAAQLLAIGFVAVDRWGQNYSETSLE